MGFRFCRIDAFFWKHKLRAQLDWVVIAILGLTVVAGIDEMISRVNNPEPDFFARPVNSGV